MIFLNVHDIIIHLSDVTEVGVKRKYVLDSSHQTSKFEVSTTQIGQ